MSNVYKITLRHLWLDNTNFRLFKERRRISRGLDRWIEIEVLVVLRELHGQALHVRSILLRTVFARSDLLSGT